MFDEVTKRGGGKRAARRGAFLLGSTALQGLLVLALVTLSARLAVRVVEGPLVPVKIVRPAPAPPPPAPAPARKESAPRPRPKPRPAIQRPLPRPTEMAQPKELPAKVEPTHPAEPPEPKQARTPAEGVTGGVNGGIEGGVVGGVVGSQAPRLPPGAGVGAGVEGGPAYPTTGYQKPAQARRNCVQSSVRIPRDLAGFVSSAPVLVQFAIRPDGTPTRFTLKTPVPDPRIEQALWNAIRQCPWIPGKDARGVPVSVWVIMPFRFTGG